MSQRPTPPLTKSRFWLLAALVAITVAALDISPTPAVEHWEVCRYCRQATLKNKHGQHRGCSSQLRSGSSGRCASYQARRDARFDRETISGTATLRFAPISQPVESLRLDAVDLNVAKVRIVASSSRLVHRQRESNDRLRPPLPAGQEAWVEVDYSAQPVEGLYFRTPATGTAKEDTHVWTQGEPFEARHWFPCFDYPNERSTTEVICHVPRP